MCLLHVSYTWVFWGSEFIASLISPEGNRDLGGVPKTGPTGVGCEPVCILAISLHSVCGMSLRTAALNSIPVSLQKTMSGKF